MDAPTTAERLRQAAVELFAERGYDGTSMADLAERVGIAKASLYNYYSGKEDLLVDMVTRALAAWDQQILPALDATGSAEHRARRYFQAQVDFVAREPHSIAILNLAASLVSGVARERVHRLLAEHRESVLAKGREVLSTALAAGDLAPQDPEDLLVYAEVFFNGLVLSQMSSPQLATPIVQRVPQLWRMFWRGLSGRAAAEPEEP